MALVVRAAFGFRFVDRFVQALGVAERAQIMQAGQIGAGDLEWGGGGADGEQQLVKRDVFPAVERDGTTNGIEVCRATTRAQLDVLLLEPVGWLRKEFLAASLAAQEFL